MKAGLSERAFITAGLAVTLTVSIKFYFRCMRLSYCFESCLWAAVLARSHLWLKRQPLEAGYLYRPRAKNRCFNQEKNIQSVMMKSSKAAKVSSYLLRGIVWAYSDFLTRPSRRAVCIRVHFALGSWIKILSLTLITIAIFEVVASALSRGITLIPVYSNLSLIF